MDLSQLPLTSVGMVEDHQFSVSFPDLILVGCGAGDTTSVSELLLG